MTLFAQKVEKFTTEFHDKLKRKYDTFDAFQNEQRANRVADSVAEYICGNQYADQVFRQLGAAMCTGLRPWMSDEMPHTWSLYTKLNIYLLGAVRDLELTRVRSVYDDTPETESDDDDGWGSVKQLNISCTTALYMLLQTVPNTVTIRGLLDEFANVTKAMLKAVEQVDKCRHVSGCECESTHEQTLEEEERALMVLIVEIGKQPVFTDELFQRGLGPFLVHQKTSIYNERFAVMRKPQDEAIEKARIAEENCKQQEAKEARERQQLEREIEEQTTAKKRAEERLDELNRKKKMKIDESE